MTTNVEQTWKRIIRDHPLRGDIPSGEHLAAGRDARGFRRASPQGMDKRASKSLSSEKFLAARRAKPTHRRGV